MEIFGGVPSSEGLNFVEFLALNSLEEPPTEGLNFVEYLGVKIFGGSPI